VGFVVILYKIPHNCLQLTKICNMEAA